MTRQLRIAVMLGTLPAALLSQTAAFDIADVRVSPRSDWVKTGAHYMQGGFLAGDRYELHRATMLDLVRVAYDVDPDTIFGGPSWLDYDRFEIVAKTQPGTRPEQLRQMLRTLLAERFALTVKPDTRLMPAYLLAKGKRALKLSPAADTSNSTGCTQRFVSDAGGPYTKVECRNVTMEVFAQTVRRLLAGPTAPLPVVDSTGLAGAWDIDLHVAPSVGFNPVSLVVIDALDQLGLKLELGKIPQPGLMVESVKEQPSPNPPGVADSLPARPAPEFEVASIKPCNDNASRSLRFESAGRVTATCVALMMLIRQAWNLAVFENPVGVPKWLADDAGGSNNISIFAKAPAGLGLDAKNNAQGRDTLHVMLRALLIERYHIKFHYEDREVDARTLVAVKPKLTKSDPSARTGCKRENLEGQGHALTVRLTCRNITMAQFAEQIQAYDSDIYYPVLDATGVDGAWDFTVTYDAFAGINARFPQFARPSAGPDGAASDPSGALGFAEAIEKQLGLKLEVHKRPEPVLVFDHIDEKPTEN